ncbi:hypothetical protein PCANC_22099 [Puccinia coronata f. sp. avenae]|uniref:Uncharacterized protein n=1 Tax=Puccinia coronata f. sp. avenae TaxID=200324 RepID=A0A2N5S4Q7_9BASI|nr:hypothetical protein PCANC_22099 [Puccinia coronata f. sp. avenae]
MQSTLVIFLICLPYSLSVEVPYEEIEMEKTISYICDNFKSNNPFNLTPQPGVRCLSSAKKKSTTKLLRTDIQKVVDNAHYYSLNPFRGFYQILAKGLKEFNACTTTLDVGDTWERYVTSADCLLDKVAAAGVKKSISASGHKASSIYRKKTFVKENLIKSLHKMSEIFKGWYVHSSETYGYQNMDFFLEQSLGQVGESMPEDLTSEAWALAIRFCHLSIMWKRKRLIHDIVTQMAILEHFGKDLNSIPGAINQRDSHFMNEYDKEAIRILHEWRQSPCHYDDAGLLNNILNKIIPHPHQMTLLHLEYLGDGTESFSQEYFAIRELVSFCRKQAVSTMKPNDSILLEDLEKVADEENMQSVMRAYKDLCIYFRNGTPLGRTFEYYQKISYITSELKQLRVDEIKKLRDNHPDYLPKASGSTRKTQPWQFEERSASEIESSLLIDKVNLFINYASEHDQLKKIRKDGSFQPTPRARKSQISEIAMQICVMLSHNFEKKEEDPRWLNNRVEKFNQEIMHSHLPIMIKERICFIVGLICNLIQVYMLGGDENDHLTHYWEEWIKEVWEEFKLRNNDSQVTQKFSLKEDIKIRDAVGKLIYRQFLNTSESNANILVEKMDSIHRYDTAQMILDQIYEAMLMLKTTPNRKAWMKKFWKKMKVYQDPSEQIKKYIKTTEFNDVKKVYDHIMENLDGSPLDKKRLTGKVLPFISCLSVDLQMLFQDLVSEDFKEKTPLSEQANCDAIESK